MTQSKCNKCGKEFNGNLYYCNSCYAELMRERRKAEKEIFYEVIKCANTKDFIKALNSGKLEILFNE